MSKLPSRQKKVDGAYNRLTQKKNNNKKQPQNYLKIITKYGTIRF